MATVSESLEENWNSFDKIYNELNNPAFLADISKEQRLAYWTRLDKLLDIYTKEHKALLDIQKALGA